MSETTPNPAFRTQSSELIPRWMIRAILALLFSVLALVTFARVTDRPLVAVPADTPVLAERAVVLASAPNGATRVSAPDGTLLADISAREGGFISGMTRVIERQRGLSKVDPATPIAIQLRDKGRITLVDPATGWSAELASYGDTNTDTFARLLGVSTETSEGSN